MGREWGENLRGWGQRMQGWGRHAWGERGWGRDCLPASLSTLHTLPNLTDAPHVWTVEPQFTYTDRNTTTEDSSVM